MSFTFQAGITYSYVARFDVRWDTLQKYGATLANMATAVRVGTAFIGNIDQIRVEHIPSLWGDSTITVSIVQTFVGNQPAGEVSYFVVSNAETGYGVINQPVVAQPGTMSSLLQNALNGYYELIHGPVNYSLNESYLTDNCYLQFRGFTSSWGDIYVIDPESITRNSTLQVASPGGVLDNAAAFLTNSTIQSTDPARDNQGYANQVLGGPLGGLPTWALGLLIGTGVLVGLVAIGYAARGVAQLAQET